MGLIDQGIDLRRAIDRLEQGRTGEAEAALAEILKAHPADAEAWYYRGRVRKATGDLRGALFCAARATVLAPEWSLRWGLLAEMRERLEGAEEAVEALRRASEIDPGWFDVRSHLAKGLWRLGRREDALRELDRILEEQPGNDEARAVRGAYRFACRRLDEAQQDLTPLVADFARLASREGTVVLTAARLARLRGDTAEAERLTRWASAGARLDLHGLVKFGRLALRLGLVDEAAAFGDRACKADPANGAANLLLALAFERRGDLEGASVHLKRASDAMPRALELSQALGSLYARLNMPVMAERMFDTVLKHQPDRLAARLGLIQLLLRGNDPFGALQVAEVGLDRAPENVELMVAAARALADLNRLDEALRLLREACRLAPDSGEAALVLGEKLALAESWLEAEDSLVRAQQLMPLDRRVGVALNSCRARLGRAGAATESSSAFALQERSTDAGGWATAWQALLVHLRIVEAVCLRDLRIRFGRERLGYLWAFIEPIMFVAIFYGLFLAVDRHIPAGMTVFSFLISGVIPWIMFASTYYRVNTAVLHNRALLYFPQVKPIDLVAARAVLEFLTILVVFVVLMAALQAVQPPGPIGDVLKVVDSLFVAWLTGIGVGLMSMSVLTVVKSFDKIMGYVIRIMFFTSGVFFLPTEMPVPIRELLMFNPMLHVIDRMREGLFVDYLAVETSFATAIGVAVVFVFLGLLGESVTRARPD